MARKLIGSDPLSNAYRLFACGGAGDFVFVSGTTGFDYSTMTIAE